MSVSTWITPSTDVSVHLGLYNVICECNHTRPFSRVSSTSKPALKFLFSTSVASFGPCGGFLVHKETVQDQNSSSPDSCVVLLRNSLGRQPTTDFIFTLNLGFRISSLFIAVSSALRCLLNFRHSDFSDLTIGRSAWPRDKAIWQSHFFHATWGVLWAAAGGNSKLDCFCNCWCV